MTVGCEVVYLEAKDFRDPANALANEVRHSLIGYEAGADRPPR
ncbi:MAG TPA: hypothetical protein VHF22_09465 [Planctomycetota bacterium]|nr:hypothetical protein [Planctomycetota bacterium]